jgi:hypothetical protein
VAEDGFDLVARYAGKPFEKVIDASPVLDIREEGLNGNSRAAKNPGAADGFDVSFNGWAGAPIKHAKG